MNNTELLKVVKEKGKSPTQMAAACDISVQSWYNKIKKAKFNVDEAFAIKKYLDLSNAQFSAIFFTKESEKESRKKK